MSEEDVSADFKEGRRCKKLRPVKKIVLDAKILTRAVTGQPVDPHSGSALAAGNPEFCLRLDAI